MTFVSGMRGLGDNIFQRAFVRTLALDRDVYLSTPWPEIYEDIPRVHFVHSATPLRTQAKNLARQPRTRWAREPRTTARIVVRYGSAELRIGSIVSAMEACFQVPPAAWDLPSFPPYVSERPVAVIRPVTERKEWHNSARNPKPEYIAAIAADLMRDYFVVSVADLADKHEWFIGNLPPAHKRYHAGELSVSDLLGLIRTAKVVVGGVGWIVPACIAAGTPLFCVLGGHGGHNGPAKITDKRMDLDHVGFAVPDRFCCCENMRHDCDKTNTKLMQQWDDWRAQCGI